MWMMRRRLKKGQRARSAGFHPYFSEMGELRRELDKDRETFTSFYRLPQERFKFSSLHNQHPSSNGKWLVPYKLRRFNICFLTRASKAL